MFYKGDSKKKQFEHSMSNIYDRVIVVDVPQNNYSVKQ